MRGKVPFGLCCIFFLDFLCALINAYFATYVLQELRLQVGYDPNSVP